jgi:hypothetical protein
MKTKYLFLLLFVSVFAVQDLSAREISNVHKAKKKKTSSTAVSCKGGKTTSAGAAREVGRGGGLGSQSESALLAKIQSHNTAAVGIPSSRVKKALDYLYAHKSQFRNQKVMTLVKYNSPDIFHNVMYIIDLGSGKIEMHTVSQGRGGINTHAGKNGSELGFMRIAEPYAGKHGGSVRIDGLEAGNRDMRGRAVVIHPASYVHEGCWSGRSEGCMALSSGVASKVIQKTKGGSLLYAF